MKCVKCGKDTDILANGRCMSCSPFRACGVCPTGTLVSCPQPNWMNRWKCDNCGKAVSR